MAEDNDAPAPVGGDGAPAPAVEPAGDNPPPAAEPKAPARDAGGKFAPKAAEEPPEWRKVLGKAGDKYSSETDLAKAYADLSSKLGKAIIPPGEKATDEEKSAYRARLLKDAGIEIPESPEAYGVTFAEDTPEHAKEFTNGLLGIAHKHAVSKAFIAEAMELMAAEEAASKKRLDDVSTEYVNTSDLELRREWRGEFAVNDAITAEARKAFVPDDLGIIFEVPGTQLAKMLGDKPLSSLADVKRMFANIGRRTGESRSVLQSSPAAQLTMAEIRKMTSDPRYEDPVRRDPAFVAEVNARITQHFGEKSL